jgi:glycine oxidase
MSSERGRPESIVVGAGLVGLSIAFELLRRGRAVTVLDRGRPGQGATRTADGSLLSLVGMDAEGEPSATLVEDSLARYPELAQAVERASGVRSGFKIAESIWIAAHRDDLEEMQRIEKFLASRTLVHRRLDSDALHALEAGLSPRVLGGLQIEKDPQLDARQFAEALRRAIESMGGRILEGMRVERVEERGGRVHAVGGTRSDGVTFAWTGAEIVVTAGASEIDPIEMPVAVPRTQPVKGHRLRLGGGRLLGRVTRTPDVCLIPSIDGGLVVCAEEEEHGEGDGPAAGTVMDLLRHAWEVVPGIYDLQLNEVDVGLGATAEDRRPVVGATQVGGLYVALGHPRAGARVAPATAHHLSSWIVDGTPPSAIAPLSPAGTRSDMVT